MGSSPGFWEDSPAWMRDIADNRLSATLESEHQRALTHEPDRLTPEEQAAG